MRVLDLFAGPGGWDVAANRLGFDPVGLEWDDAACATRRAAGFATLQGDVAALDPHTACPRPDGLLASPPCQAFSTAGKRKGRDDLPNIRRCSIQLRHGRDHRADHDWHDERAALVVEPLRWVLALRPEWTCWEQVPPVLPYWQLCAKLLESVGYHVWTGNLHAEQYGVPQTRRRAVLVASRVGPVGPPAATYSRYYPRDKARLDPGVQKWVSMAEALGWDAGTAGHDAGNRKWVVGQRRCSSGGNREREPRTLDDPSYTILTARGSHSPGVGRTPGVEWCYERPSTTVNCDPRISAPGRHDPNDSGSQQRGAIRVSVQEAAILQSFPADFPWQGTRTKQFEQVGNAIPPGLAGPVIQAGMAPSLALPVAA